MSRILTAGAAAALATFGLFAALPAAHAATSAVEYGDLDLATPEGQAKLESRIVRASRKVCSEAITGSRIASVDADCMARARAQIERQIASRRAAFQRGG